MLLPLAAFRRPRSRLKPARRPSHRALRLARGGTRHRPRQKSPVAARNLCSLRSHQPKACDPGRHAKCADKVYDIPANWRQGLDRYQNLPGHVPAQRRRPRRLLGRAGQAHRLDQALHQGQEHLLRARQCLDQMVRGRHAQRLGQLHRPPSGQRAATRPRSSGRATIRPRTRSITYRELHERVCRFANVLKAQRRQEGRPRHHLPADDPGGGLRHAGLRPHRRGAFGGVRRLLAGQPGRPHRGLRTRSFVITADEGLRGGKPIPLKTNADEALTKLANGGEKVLVVRRTGGKIAWTAGARHLVARRAGEGQRRLPAGGDERRGPAVHPLHLGLDRQAQGRAAHHRRLSGLRRADAPIRVRLPRRRRLLVHRRRRLGHRPQLHRLRPAGQRRHHADVRRRAELSDRRRASGRSSTSTRSTSSTPRRPPSAR